MWLLSHTIRMQAWQKLWRGDRVYQHLPAEGALELFL